MGKHTRHLHLVEPGAAMALNPVPAPDPHRPPPVSAATRRELASHMAAVLFLEAVEAGSDKARELDGELLTCCAEAHEADQAADTAMDRLGALPADDPAVLDALARMQPLFGTYLDAVERAVRLPARTPEGLRAKASLLLLHLRSGDDPAVLAASLARDVAGRAS
jgi:hypothetical protein